MDRNPSLLPIPLGFFNIFHIPKEGQCKMNPLRNPDFVAGCHLKRLPDSLQKGANL
jgi:hypothetical protein